jgi:transcriptional regulator with XRE-family HTH domain
VPGCGGGDEEEAPVLAKKLEPPDRHEPQDRRRRWWPALASETSAQTVAAGRWRTRGRIPTRGPAGCVRWWERPPPGGDDLLWEAVIRLHEQRQALGISVTALADRLREAGSPVRRETLSRLLNGVQPTSWDTADALAHLLGVSLDELHERRFAAGEPPAQAATSAAERRTRVSPHR